MEIRHNSSLNSIDFLVYPMNLHRHIVVNPKFFEIIRNRALDNCRPIAKQVEYDVMNMIKHEKYDL